MSPASPRVGRRVLAGLGMLAVLGYGMFLGLLYLKQDAILFPGTQRQVDPQPPRTGGAEALRLVTPAGEVEAVFLPARAPGSARQPVVLFGHGNGEVVDDWLTALDSFRDRGIGVLLVEYPGYGRASGVPSESSIGLAMVAAYDRIATDPRVDPERLFGFGQSLGGGAICLLARQRPLRALILQSTFPSLDIFPARYGAPAFLLQGHFDSLAAVAHFAGPLLVIHGRADRLIPWQQGQRLATTAPHATFRLYECGHGCWDPAHQPFWRDAEPMLRQAGILTGDLAAPPTGTPIVPHAGPAPGVATQAPRQPRR